MHSLISFVNLCVLQRSHHIAKTGMAVEAVNVMRVITKKRFHLKNSDYHLPTGLPMCHQVIPRNVLMVHDPLLALSIFRPGRGLDLRPTQCSDMSFPYDHPSPVSQRM